MVAGAGKGNFQLLDTAAVSPFDMGVSPFEMVAKTIFFFFASKEAYPIVRQLEKIMVKKRSLGTLLGHFKVLMIYQCSPAETT